MGCLFGLDGNSAHIERMRSTAEECILYVTKDDTSLGFRFRLGRPPVPQHTGEDTLEYFRGGGTVADMAKDPTWDDMLLRLSLHRLTELQLLVNPRSRDPSVAPVCEVHFGAPGTGKSRGVFQNFPNAYKKPSGKWWDHYHGETEVILDDFDGSFVQFGDFKRWVDRYPLYIEVKGGYVPILATSWIITTNEYPSHWWSLKSTGGNGRDAIWRRITRVYHYEEPGAPPTVYDDPALFRWKMNLDHLDPKGEK